MIERQNANLEQLKQQIRQLKMTLQSKTRHSGRLSGFTNSALPSSTLLNRDKGFESETSV